MDQDPPQPGSDRAGESEARPAGNDDTLRGRLHAWADWFFRDQRSGRIVVAHIPNVAILLWMGTLVARQFVESGTTARSIVDWTGSIALGWWAIDELVRGVNPWRRSLGLIGCIAVVIGVVSRLQG
jgi:hypothetical protein